MPPLRESNRKDFLTHMPRYFDAANVASEDLDRFVEIDLEASNDTLKETLMTLYASPAVPRLLWVSCNEHGHDGVCSIRSTRINRRSIRG